MSAIFTEPPQASGGAAVGLCFSVFETRTYCVSQANLKVFFAEIYFTFIYVCVCLRVCMCYVYICVCLCMYVHVCVDVCACLSIGVCTCVYACV